MRSPEEAAALAAALLSPDRTYPVVVVSIPSGQATPRIDASEIADAVRGLAEVAVLPTDERSWRFSESMPPMTQVYGGAGRVYPLGLGWTTDPYRSPLRFAYDDRGGARATHELISDALGMARDAGLLESTGHAVDQVAVDGVVRMLVEPSRALVLLSDGGAATIWQELTAPGAPIADLLAPGMRVSGSLDRDTRRLDVTSMRTGPAAVEHYVPGDVVLAKVTQVQLAVVHLALHPDVVIPVPDSFVTGNPLDELTSLFTVGEVVVARVASRDGDRLTLRLDDVDDDDDVRPAPPVLVGGPPWLRAPVTMQPAPPVETERPAERTAPASASPVSPPMPTPGPPRGALRDLSLTLDAAQAEIRRLESELHDAISSLAPARAERDHLARAVADLQAERQRLLEQVASQRTHLRKRLQASRDRRPNALPEAEPPAATCRLFLDPVEQLRHEVYLEWASRISAAEKGERPLVEYDVGPEFLASLDRLDDVHREKVVQVIVEVVTGLADQLDGRDVHVLRTGPGGGDPPVTREDGARCWRVALQRNTPSARRLHYWKKGGRVELSRVALHDDMRP